MTDKLYLIRPTGRLNCKWVLTGDPRLPLACIWSEPRNAQPVTATSSRDETGGIHQCA